MKLPGWVVVSEVADPRTVLGYYFTQTPPRAASGKVYGFEIDVPDPVPIVPAETVPFPEPAA